jgi:ankyrin repeat protein
VALEYSSKGDAASLEKVIKEKKTDINYYDYHGITALHYAAGRGHIECLKLLISLGAKVDQSCKEVSVI